MLLILVAFMLAMGRYRGYRLTELFASGPAQGLNHVDLKT